MKDSGQVANIAKIKIYEDTTPLKGCFKIITIHVLPVKIVHKSLLEQRFTTLVAKVISCHIFSNRNAIQWQLF